MAITYAPSVNFGAKDSLPSNDPSKVIKGSEFSVEFTAIQTAFGLAAPAASPTFTGTVTIPTADINGGTVDGTTIGGTTPAAATFTSVTATTADINGGNIDGTVIGAATPAAGSFTTFTSNGIDDNASATAVTLDASGNVGIGVTPSAWNSAFDAVQIGRSTALWSQNNYDKTWLTTNVYLDSAGNFKYISTAPVSTYNQVDGTHVWGYAASGTTGATASIEEAMRIDSSGNLLVGGTTAEAATSTTIYQSGQIVSRVDGTYATEFRRDTSDGDISVFKRGTTTVGSIGTNSDGDFCFTGASNVGIGFQGNAFVPLNGSSARTDNAKDVGAASVRFDDIYATNAIIQTSDRNEKQDIEELTEAERRVAVAAKGLLRKFRWISSVEEKGDEARIHFGIIAQDLQAAFEAEGLDAGRYAMFIHSTWTDEETGEERSRMGVRYSELLAFIIAAL